MFKGKAIRIRGHSGAIIPQRIYIVDGGGSRAGYGWTMHESNALPTYDLEVEIDETQAIDAKTMKIITIERTRG